MSAKETLIKVENLQKYYKGGAIKALDGINTEIKKGEVVVVIGPSGSGKSTFLRCLNLLEVPTGGHILFEGTDITDEKTNINIHRQKMGMVFQHFNLFPSHDDSEKHDDCTHEASEKERDRGNRKGDGAAQACRLGGQSECVSLSAFGRTEAAYRPLCVRFAWSLR